MKITRIEQVDLSDTCKEKTKIYTIYIQFIYNKITVNTFLLFVCLSSGGEPDHLLPIDTHLTHTFTSASSPASHCSLLLPPSYSLALGLDLQGPGEEEQVELGFRKRMLTHAKGERSDFLSDSASTSCPLASRTQELTASELLRNR